MKNLHFITKSICILFAAISIASCSNDILTEPDLQENPPLPHDDMRIAYPQRELRTRGASPDLNWDNWTRVKIASGDSVYVPWNTRYVGTAIPVEIRQDVKSSRGWDLIAHTVNGYGEPGMNYLIFHNKFTGILKVFYYLEPRHSAPQNTAIWKLHFEVPQSCLAFTPEYANLSGQKDINDIYLGNITNDESKGYTVGWNCFQTELAYDPDLTVGTLQIIPSSMTTSSIQLDGTTESTTEGLIISATNSNIMSGKVKTSANFVGKKAENWVQKAVSEGTFKKISSLVVKGAGSIVSSGVSSLLGSFIGGFNKQKETTQSVQLKTNGTVTLEGEIKTLQTGIIMPLSLSISPSDVGPLGLWSLNEVPTIGLDPIALHYGKNDLHPGLETYEMFIEFPRYFYGTQRKCNINPSTLSAVKKYEMSATYYRTSSTKLRDVFKKGRKGTWTHAQPKINGHLYNDIYREDSYVRAEFVFKDEYGEAVYLEDVYPPIEVYIPSFPEGRIGAIPEYTFDSDYIVVINMELQVEQEGETTTIVSSHTFIPGFKWNYNLELCGYYDELYPAVPLKDLLN